MTSGNTVTPEMQGSLALQLITTQGWDWKPSTSPNVELETCPYCGKSGYGHFYIEIRGKGDAQYKRDGLHQCHRCGKSGSLYSLKEHLGLVIQGVQSPKDWSNNTTAEPLPDVETCHQALLEDEAAMDYLVNGRGFTVDIIGQQKIGLVPKRYFKDCGEVRALVYPYLVNGKCVWAHYRSLPTMPLSDNKVIKAFSSPTGWESMLYNGGILLPGLKEVIMVEGEPDCIAAMQHGITNIVGVPGANIKKAEWINTLDKLGLEKIYVCYDKDKVGQEAAKALVNRIGVERCWKIVLPEFTVTTEDGEVRPGKDLNEWFCKGGGTAEAFQKLKEEADLFDVDGVSSSESALVEFKDQLMGAVGLEPKYKTPWPSLNELVGFDLGDTIDIIADGKIGKSVFALNLIEHMVDAYGEDGVIICLEMLTIKQIRRWVSHKAQVADNIPNTPEQAVALKNAFLQGIDYAQKLIANRPGTLYFCYPKFSTEGDIYKLIRDIIRRYGVRWFVLDNIQRLCDRTIGGKNRTQHLSQISKMTSQIGKDYGAQAIRIIQPHSVSKGQIVTSLDADGASQIRKDCDCSMSLHRNPAGGIKTVTDWENMPYIKQEIAFDDKMLVMADLSRYSSGGQCTLFFDGARSTVSEYSVAQVAKIKADATKDIKSSPSADLAALGIAPSAGSWKETEITF